MKTRDQLDQEREAALATIDTLADCLEMTLATYAQSSPSSRSAAFCIAGDRECSTGSPSTHARPVVARIT